MLDIKFVRANPEAVKENIRKKFQDEKLPLVDEVIEKDQQYRDAKTRGDYLRGQRNTISKQIGGLMAKGQKEEAEQRLRRWQRSLWSLSSWKPVWKGKSASVCW